MNIKFFEQLHADEDIDDGILESVKTCERSKNISVRRELLIMLYFGIVLFSTGMGILIYDNVDSIGHLSIILFIAAITIACFTYCFRKAAKPSLQKIESPNVWFDYILLLGCLMMLVFVGYIQFQYEFFGNRWGLATFIPFTILAFSAYYFDHLGVLSLAITNLAAWMGISVNLLQVRGINVFSSGQLIYSGILLGILLQLLAILSTRRNIKEHFAFTYTNFGVHILFIALLAGMFDNSNPYMLYFLALAAFSTYIFLQAKRNGSFYFLLVSVLYFYIGFSYIVVMLLIDSNISEGGLYTGLMYFIASGIGLVFLLMNMNKTIRRNDSIQ